MKVKRKTALIIITSVLSVVMIMVLTIYLLNIKSGPDGTSDHIFATPKASTAGKPTLDKLELVTDQAFGNADQYVPNSWGAHKDRIIRTANGNLFMTYISAGEGLNDRAWHLMYKTPQGSWQEIKSGNAGTEPVNIVLGNNDSIHIFAWPGTQGKLQHIFSTDNGKSFTSEWIAGDWRKDQEQGYSSVGVNDQGDMVLIQTGQDKPGTFLWTYYDSQTGKWTFHHNTLDLRYTYAFLFPGYNHDLTIIATRDVKRRFLGLPESQDGGNPWIFNQVKYFYIANVNSNEPQISQTLIKDLPPKDPNDTSDRDLTYVTDSYVDTAGRLHVLYLNEYDGPHQAILEDGKILKDVRMPQVSFGQKMRMTQDTLGHFYIISMDEQGHYINVYPGTANDTDGTQLNSVTRLDIAQLPGCTDYDFCHSPTFTVPRNGHALSDSIDGVYGNFNKEIYFHINLRGNSKAETSTAPNNRLNGPALQLAHSIDEKRKELQAH